MINLSCRVNQQQFCIGLQAVCLKGSDIFQTRFESWNNQYIDIMGNNQPKKLQQTKFTSQHPSLNDAKLVVEENNRKYIQAKFKTQNAQYDEWHKHFTGPNKVQSDYLLLPQHSEFKSDLGLCGNTGTLTAQYPHFPYLLSELIKQRQAERQLFKESQLWFLLLALVAAKQDIKKHSRKLGDIKPENVFVNEEGFIKVVNVYSWPGELSSFTKAVDQIKLSFNGLLAPEDLVLLQNNHIENQQNDQSEMFAIGATILSAGILEVFSTVYDYSKKVFNEEAFRDKRRVWGENERYSQIFKSIIWNLVELNPNNRLTIDQLWNFILPYQVSILDKKQFVIQSAPKKVENSHVALRSKAY